MKDYENVVIWLDYFNKTISRKMGRRIPRDKSIFDPSLKELIDAAKDLGLEPKDTNDQVRFPRRPFVRSGYIALAKTQTKAKLIAAISAKLISRRTKQSSKQ
jgi:signal recognition particle subunit SRP19